MFYKFTLCSFMGFDFSSLRFRVFDFTVFDFTSFSFFRVCDLWVYGCRLFGVAIFVFRFCDCRVYGLPVFLFRDFGFYELRFVEFAIFVFF